MISLVLALTASLPPAQSEPTGPGSDAASDELALVIDGEPISIGVFTRWLVRFRGEARAIDFVDSWVIEREAERLGIELPDEEVSAAARAAIGERIDRLFHGDREKWLAELAREKRTVRGVLRELELRLRNEMLAERILRRERPITDEVLRREWVRRYGAGGRTIEARVIEIDLDVPPAPPGATLRVLQKARKEAIDRAEETALQVRDEILETKNFSGLARRYSAHESASRGGELLNGFVPGDWSSDVLDPLSKVGPGELSPPIFGMGAWWLFRVDEVRETPFESVRDELRDQILAEPPTQEEFGLLYARLAAKADWEVQPAMWAQGLDEVAGNDVVLTIDGTPIRREEYARWLLALNGEVIAPRFVEAWVIEREAQKRGVKIAQDEILRRIEREKNRLFEESGIGSRQLWLDSSPGGRTEESMVRDMLVSHVPVFLAEDMLMASREITEADVRRRWEERYGVGGKSLDARMIRLQVAEARPPRGASDEEYERLHKLYLEKKALADELVERIANGEDFGALARKYSDDETRLRGGEFEGGFRAQDWPTGVSETLSKLQVGQVTEPLEVGASLCIFELLDYREVPFEDVRGELKKELEEEPPTVQELAEFRNVLVRDVPFTVEGGIAN